MTPEKKILAVMLNSVVVTKRKLTDFLPYNADDKSPHLINFCSKNLFLAYTIKKQRNLQLFFCSPLKIDLEDIVHTKLPRLSSLFAL